jgi:hypothetical protein
MIRSNLQVIQGKRVTDPAVLTETDILVAYNRWSRADKPIGLARLAWELGVSQNFLAREFIEIVHRRATDSGYAAGRASLWRAA